MDKNNKNNNFILRVDNVSLRFGAVIALADFTLEVKGKEILAIIGPNGAGKTSLLNCISGFYCPQAGNIYFMGKDITFLPTHKHAALGISRTFQNIELYDGMSTMDNLMVGRHPLMKNGVISGALYFGRGRRIEIEHRRRVEEIIDLLGMESIREELAGFLTYGQRKKVDMGRALASEPKFILLDEPMAGMNLDEKEDMARYIIDIHELRGIPVILIEHDMEVVMDIADRVVVLDFGAKIAEGAPSEIKTNPRVIEAYLGAAAGEKK